MKAVIILFIACATLFAETRQEAELKKELAAAQSALAAERARVNALSAGTQKLTEAVAVQAETSKANTEKIEAVKDKIEEAQANDHKLAETVKSQAVETQKATKKLADAVSVQGSATVSALSDQMKQQERSAQSDARRLANDLKDANVARDKANADRVAAEEQSATRQAKMQKAIDDLKVTADIIADKKDAREKGYAFWTMVVMMVFVPLATGAVTYLTFLQKGTHAMVNGQRTAMEVKIKELEEREHARQVLEALHTPPPNERPA